MLFNPKWRKVNKTDRVADVRSLDNLIAWLETQDPKQTYMYTEPNECLLAQYLQAHGYRDVNVNSKSWGWNWYSHKELLPPHFNSIAMGEVEVRSGAVRLPDWTFGAALRRARAIAK